MSVIKWGPDNALESLRNWKADPSLAVKEYETVVRAINLAYANHDESSFSHGPEMECGSAERRRLRSSAD